MSKNEDDKQKVQQPNQQDCTKITLDEQEVSQQQLEETAKQLPKSKRIVEVSTNKFKTIGRMFG